MEDKRNKIIEEVSEKFNVSMKEAKAIFDCQFTYAKKKIEEGVDHKIMFNKLGVIKKTKENVR